ncbi:transposase [Actinomycetes bacterium KLBMP 9797]
MSGEEDDAVALVRVYCGLATADPTARQAPAESRLTVAVVDDAGRLLDVCEISDDPAGYALLGALLVERSSGPTGVAIAADSDDHLVTSLLTAAGRPLAIADDDAADDYAERFADDESVEEMESPAAERRAVGLARALQAGALSAVVLPVPRDLVPYKPVLAAHAALCNGRLAAAAALREVLRELYPAALRAYPDPAEPVSLAVLDALPEPSMVSGSGGRRDSTAASQAIVARLAADGVADAEAIDDAITALRVAISESRRAGTTNKTVTSAIAESVRQSVAAVRACDSGCEALIGTLSARITTPPTSARRTVRRVGTEQPATPAAAPATTGLHAVPARSEPMPTRTSRRARPEAPAASSAPVTPQPLTTPPVAPAPVSRPPVAPPPVNRPAAAAAEPPAPPVAPPMSPAAITAPTPLPIRSSAPPARPALPAASSAPMHGAPTPLPVTSGPPMPSAPLGPRAPEAPAARAPELPGRPTEQPGRAFDLPSRAPEQPGRTFEQPGRAPQLPGRVPEQPGRAPEQPGWAPQLPAARLEGPANRPISPPPPPPPGITPIAPLVPTQRSTAPVDAGEPFRATLTTAAINSARAERRPTPIVPRPNTRTDPPPPPATGGFAATDLTVPVPAPRPALDAPPPGSRANWPLVSGSSDDDRPYGYGEPQRPAASAGAPNGRVTPPWQADDLPQEPPTLRLVEPPPLADRALREDLGPIGLPPLDAPPLRLVDADGPGARSARSRRAVERSAAPVPEEGDGDLLIFAQTRSAWFVGHPEAETDLMWSSSEADSGWRAAEQLAQPVVGAETTSGLPRRVPNANLVPGSPLPPREERPLRIVRDAQSIAAHTTGYFQGWRRGQEIGGYAVGGRPGRESAGGWDFSRDTTNPDRDDRDDREDRNGYEYRSAGYRS